MTTAFIADTADHYDMLASLGIKPARVGKCGKYIGYRMLAIHHVSDAEATLLTVACPDAVTVKNYTPGEILVAGLGTISPTFYVVEGWAGKRVIVRRLFSRDVSGTHVPDLTDERGRHAPVKATIEYYGVRSKNGVMTRWDGTPVSFDCL